MSLTLENLACHRGGRVVFHDLDFRLAAGQAGLVRGPNGVGKSTLLRVLAGLIPPIAGDAAIDGLGLRADPTGFQEQIVYAGHLDAVKPALTVAQNLGVWAAIFGAGPARTEEALAFFGLDVIGGRPAVQCSAGQKRRLGLARLMVVDRPLWLLDEPTVSLDAASAGQVAQLVTRHCARGGMALIATHVDLDLEDPPVLEMNPPAAPASPAVADAFLAGDW